MQRRPLSICVLTATVLAVLLWVATSAGPAKAGNITVFAAASLKTALDDIAEEFEAQTGHAITRSYAGSSALARQIELGAPADLFISASTDWMNYLAEQDLIEPNTRHDLLSNRIVLIAPKGSAHAIRLEQGVDLTADLGEGYLAMALVDAVPAGIYGKAALGHFDLWDSVAPKVAQTDNVRAALALVALGEATLGITYETDARAEPRVEIVATFPTESHPPIRYPMAAVKGQKSEATLALLTFLKGTQARQVFKRHGFAVVGE